MSDGSMLHVMASAMTRKRSWQSTIVTTVFSVDQSQELQHLVSHYADIHV